MTESINQVKNAELKHFGARLDQVMAELFSEFSRSRLKQWILDGAVSIDGETCKTPRHKLKGCESLSIAVELEPEVFHQPESLPLNIVFENEHVIVINKPRGVVVHPGAGNRSGTLLNALLGHCSQLEQLPRAGIVHRLDKDTTGLMVVAKTLLAHTHLVTQLQAREMSREYEAICYDELISGGIVDAPIGRHPTQRIQMAVREQGKPAVTHYRVIEKFRGFTHLRLKLETGRTHQIRVHMAHIRHPLVGDYVYAGRTRLPKAASDEFIATLRGFDRQALHAIQLGFLHPESNKPMQFNAEHEQDFIDLRNACRRYTQEQGLDD